ncbi:hypothetical protein J2X72_000850 [Phyllobacterium sp. 1468]|nr:hypothetical protein [Phyllobacterium sp. 1468]
MVRISEITAANAKLETGILLIRWPDLIATNPDGLHHDTVTDFASLFHYARPSNKCLCSNWIAAIYGTVAVTLNPLPKMIVPWKSMQASKISSKYSWAIRPRRRCRRARR